MKQNHYVYRDVCKKTFSIVESDLVGMLGKQLYLAECRMQRMQTMMSTTDNQLKDKDQEIGRLKRKVLFNITSTIKSTNITITYTFGQTFINN